MNKICKFLTLSIVITAIFIMNITVAFADGSFSVTGGGTVKPSSSSTIQITASDCVGKFSISATNGAKVSESSIWAEKETVSITVTAPSNEGSFTVKVEATNVSTTGEDAKLITGEKAIKFEVVKPAESSKPTESTSSQTSTSKPTESTSSQTSTSKPTESTSSQTSTSKPTESTSSQTSTSKPTESTSSQTSTSKPTESTSSQTSTSKPTESTSSQTSTSKPNLSTGVVTSKPIINSNTAPSKTEVTRPTTSSEDDTSSPDTTVDKSSDNDLSSLTLSGGAKLSPSFSAEVTSYEVYVKDLKQITINATAKDSKAVIYGDGIKDIKAGSNDFAVVVTAEDGKTNTYQIKVVVSESPTIFKYYNEQKLGFVKDVSLVIVPDGFEETTITVDGEDVVAWENTLAGMIVVYLENEKQEQDFYIYDDKVVSKIYPLGLMGKNIYIIDIQKESQEKIGMKYQEIEIDGNKLMGWSFEDENLSNYFVIQVLDMLGHKIEYLYEKTENSMILYPSVAPISVENYETVLKQNKTLQEQKQDLEEQKEKMNLALEKNQHNMIIMSVVALVLLIVSIVFVFALNIKNKKVKKAQKELENQEKAKQDLKDDDNSNDLLDEKSSEDIAESNSEEIE